VPGGSATLDWSDDLLSEAERQVLCRLIQPRWRFHAGSSRHGGGFRRDDRAGRHRNASETWSGNRLSPQMSVVRKRAVVCSRRHGPTRSKNSPKAASATVSRP